MYVITKLARVLSLLRPKDFVEILIIGNHNIYKYKNFHNPNGSKSYSHFLEDLYIHMFDTAARVDCSTIFVNSHFQCQHLVVVDIGQRLLKNLEFVMLLN